MNPKELAAEAAITLAQELGKHGIVTFHVQNVVNLSQPIIQSAIEKAVKPWREALEQRIGESDAKLIQSRAAQSGEPEDSMVTPEGEPPRA